MIDSSRETVLLSQSKGSDCKGERELSRSEEGGREVNFTNCYEDVTRAREYATLEFANTYYLAYRDLPAIFAKYAPGKRALDFGCGTGRSTRFLQELGFSAIGVDISEDMLRIARATDP
ncbi:MAG TPA: class I SAM-dependent methyltransferase, partial [Candidatus Sulfotelmatobacter sp.]|nr:class I SAM-dependent methyltransferase [Candidatus Sulfotelmatobacter sp.]